MKPLYVLIASLIFTSFCPWSNADETRRSLIVNFSGDSAKKTAAILKTPEGQVISQFISCTNMNCTLNLSKENGRLGVFKERSLDGNPFFKARILAFDSCRSDLQERDRLYCSLYSNYENNTGNVKLVVTQDYPRQGKNPGYKSWTISNSVVTCYANLSGTHEYTFSTIATKDINSILND